MNVNVKINKLIPDGNIKAYASINFDNCFAVTGLKVMEGSKGMFVSMPSYKSGNEFKEVAFPLNKDMRTQLNQAILKEYDKALALEQRQEKQPPSFTFNNEQSSSTPSMNVADEMDDLPYEMNMN